MKQKLMILGLCLVAAGCVKHVRTENVTGPNGTQVIMMKCGNMPACYKEAGKLCPGGYVKVDESSSVSGSNFGVRTRGTMLIQCKS